MESQEVQNSDFLVSRVPSHEISSPISIFQSTNYCDHFNFNSQRHWLKKSTLDQIYSRLPFLFPLTSTDTGDCCNDDYTYFLEGSTTQAQEFLINLVYLLTYHDNPETKSWLEEKCQSLKIREVSTCLFLIDQIASAFQEFHRQSEKEPEEQVQATPSHEEHPCEQPDNTPTPATVPEIETPAPPTSNLVSRAVTSPNLLPTIIAIVPTRVVRAMSLSDVPTTRSPGLLVRLIRRMTPLRVPPLLDQIVDRTRLAYLANSQLIELYQHPEELDPILAVEEPTLAETMIGISDFMNTRMRVALEQTRL
jgi:hypothetical protein